jgi:hypothetical protein
MKTTDRVIDRELKIMLLAALKRGYFTQEDRELLSKKVGFMPTVINIIKDNGRRQEPG